MTSTSAMRIFLIRHAETVDNRANLYAGTTDSALTVHGNLQAERLAKYFVDLGVCFTYIFSSDLQRAYKTAFAICLAQSKDDIEGKGSTLEVVPLAVLREQDFGDYEGKPFYERPRDSGASGKGDHRSDHREDPDFKGVESKASMTERTKTFLKEHLVPIVRNHAQSDACAVAIISHGILLSQLWKSFLDLLPEKSVAVSPGLSSERSGLTPPIHLGGWSNTGFLELILQGPKELSIEQQQSLSPPNHSSSESSNIELSKPRNSLESLSNIEVMIKTVNGKDHLIGLKRTRGGVGSSKHDGSQKTIESFLKKRKV